MEQKIEQFEYDNGIVRKFAIASIVYGIVGMLVGLWLASEFIWPGITFDIPWLTFGRLRPLHTNAVVFAFVGNGMFLGIYYSMQRLLKARMWSDKLSNFHFWGWQAIIAAAAITLPLGYTSTHEYAELEWPIDLAIAVVWIAWGINMIMTMVKRRETHIYVAIWFYIATWVTITVLHVGNNLEVPVTFWKSYPVFAGIQDALIQWWYGHNAVAFFLTTPYLGLMYYYLPKAAKRPVYSYRLSIIHFWGLIFLYIWAGPHHLLYSDLPNWVQSLGTVFSIMLIAPSWGGMLNGLLTLRGAWDRVRTDPILKFMVVAVTSYGMATLEGPLLSIKFFNAITHFTDWTVAHVHVGALGWNGFMVFGVLYWLIPRMYKTKLYSVSLANTHFWIGTLGILFYVIPMYWTGFTQSLMWKQFTAEGMLAYPDFLSTVVSLIPMYGMRLLGGTLYFTGVCIMVYNLMKTASQGSFVANEKAEAAALPVKEVKNGTWHRWIENRPNTFHVFTFIAIIIGGVVEIVPMVLIESNIPKIDTVVPYTALELEGRDIYIREGCVGCHSQMVRPFRSETVRYGEYTRSGELIYDRPFLFGSKRTGPDLFREGGKRDNMWHYDHMIDPTIKSDGSIMPTYSWLADDIMYLGDTEAKMKTLKYLGTPYSREEIENCKEDYKRQAEKIAASIKAGGVEDELLAEREIIALIGYLQKLGTGLK